jgi:hypothetical protein
MLERLTLVETFNDCNKNMVDGCGCEISVSYGTAVKAHLFFNT